ncbi:hypothetical protein CBR_g38797 [Chara braunii]|uniref:F-box domain-containing protein n=1 Tax=Chara braunii TaxID=69332 RepID=A0A388LQJ1_CHABU|nr:hypothetical protein CBR_g38797 [Chara braunii]|eukprot:GBG84515.1 hypothetical protein CBR_g38797 [Chara braunii]
MAEARGGRWDADALGGGASAFSEGGGGLPAQMLGGAVPVSGGGGLPAQMRGGAGTVLVSGGGGLPAQMRGGAVPVSGGGGLPAQMRGGVPVSLSSSPSGASEGGGGDGGRIPRVGGTDLSQAQAEAVDDVVPSSAAPAEQIGGGDIACSSPRVEDWSDMVHEGLVVVFRYLSVKDRIVVGAVCRSWRRASLDPGCWREADLTPLPLWTEGSKNVFFDVLLTRSKGQLRKLSADLYPAKCLDRIWRECPLLEDLRFLRCSCAIEEAPLEQLSAGLLSHLRVLKLNKLDILQTWDSETRVLATADALVIAIARGCKQLVSLSLNGDYTQFTDTAVEAIVEHLPRLERLGLSGSVITDASLALIGAQLKSLRKLKALCCWDLTDEGVSALKSARKDLKVLTSSCRSSLDSGDSDGLDIDYEEWYEEYDDFDGEVECDYDDQEYDDDDERGGW